MPFIDQEQRKRYPVRFGFDENLDSAAINGVVGDRCFVFYREMIHAWKKEPRWTTAHALKVNMINNMPYLGVDDRAAYELAFAVFFNTHVMRYEERKREENGEVE